VFKRFPFKVSKAFQAVPRLFPEKKDCLFSMKIEDENDKESGGQRTDTPYPFFAPFA